MHTMGHVIHCHIVKNGIKHQKKTPLRIRQIEKERKGECVLVCVCTKGGRLKNGCALTLEELRAIVSLRAVT